MFLSLAEFDSVMSGKLDNDILIVINAYHVVCGVTLLKIWNLIEKKPNLELLYV
ncbi:hypothetical protein Bca4012_044381 [Brassica carinata]